MSELAARAGEMLMIGFQGTELPQGLADQIERDRVGGVILFARNLRSAQQVRELTGQLQRLAPAGRPLLIAADEEGGIVSRLGQSGVGTGFPGNMALGATRNAALVHRTALATGRELAALGINFNLAPVLDVNNNPYNPVIGVRSYGADPDLVAHLGGAAIRGYEEAGVLSCAKHFPGHGDTAVDSHLALPLIPHDLGRLEAMELLPFQAAIQADVPAIMTAHIVFPALEDNGPRPATLSRAVLTGLLRERMGYEGLIVTDCLEMKAIAEHFGVVQGAVEALKAGADLVLISHTPELQRQAVAAIRSAILSGELPASQVASSLKRLDHAKGWLSSRVAPPPEVLRSNLHLGLAQEVADLAVTVAWDPPRFIPVNPKEMGLVICRPGIMTEVEEGAPPSLLAELAETEVPDAEVLVVDQSPTDAQTEAAVSLAGRCGTLVVATYGANRFPRQARLIQAALTANRRVIVLAQRDPYDHLTIPPGVGAYMVAYENRAPLLRAALHVLTGRLPAQGEMPV